MEKEEINFEDAMLQLEEIATTLEKGDLNLDDSVTFFEKGMQLSKACNDVLEKAEKRISILLNENGEVEEKKFIQNEE